jgi:hypothetical protein
MSRNGRQKVRGISMKQNETVLEIGLGVPIADASQLAVDLAKQRKSTIVFRYNNIEIKVSPKTKPEFVVNAFFSKAAILPNMGMAGELNSKAYGG